MITIEEFKKIDLRVGKVEEITKDRVIINLGSQNISINTKIRAKVGDKVVCKIDNNHAKILAVSSVPFSPEKDVPLGSKIR